MALNLRPLLLLSLLTLAACGKEKGRVPFAADGTGTTTATLEAGDVAFWADLDLEYEGSAAMSYAVELEQGGTVVASGTCNPLGAMNVKVNWVETNIGSSHSRSGSGKMGCHAKVPAAGATNVKVTLAISTRPATFTLKKADFVLKQ